MTALLVHVYDQIEWWGSTKCSTCCFLVGREAAIAAVENFVGNGDIVGLGSGELVSMTAVKDFMPCASQNCAYATEVTRPQLLWKFLLNVVCSMDQSQLVLGYLSDLLSTSVFESIKIMATCDSTAAEAASLGLPQIGQDSSEKASGNPPLLVLQWPGLHCVSHVMLCRLMWCSKKQMRWIWLNLLSQLDAHWDLNPQTSCVVGWL